MIGLLKEARVGPRFETHIVMTQPPQFEFHDTPRNCLQGAVAQSAAKNARNTFLNIALLHSPDDRDNDTIRDGHEDKKLDCDHIHALCF